MALVIPQLVEDALAEGTGKTIKPLKCLVRFRAACFEEDEVAQYNGCDSLLPELKELHAEFPTLQPDGRTEKATTTRRVLDRRVSGSMLHDLILTDHADLTRIYSFFARLKAQKLGPITRKEAHASVVEQQRKFGIDESVEVDDVEGVTDSEEQEVRTQALSWKVPGLGLIGVLSLLPPGPLVLCSPVLAKLMAVYAQDMSTMLRTLAR